MTSEHVDIILSLVMINLIGLVSPGPDFAVIVKNSVVYSRKTGFLTSFGLALGTVVHMTYILLGMGLVIANTPWMLLTFQYLGASYLFYLGAKGVLAKKAHLNLGEMHHNSNIRPIMAIRMGFLTNLLNPKAMLFFMSMFSVLLTAKTPSFIVISFSFMIFATTFLWFSFVSVCLSGKSIREKFKSMGHWIDRVTGVILIALALKFIFL